MSYISYTQSFRGLVYILLTWFCFVVQYANKFNIGVIMAILRKVLANSKYSKIDNNVARNKEIKDYSFRYYCFVAGYKNGFQLNDEYVATCLGWQRDKVARAKRDLIEAGLLLVEKIDRSTYFLYIGNSSFKASEVKKHWDDLERVEQ